MNLHKLLHEWYLEYLQYSKVLKTLVGIKTFYLIIWVFVILGVVSINSLLYVTLETLFLVMLGIYGFYLFNPMSHRKLDQEDRIIGSLMAGFILWLINYKYVYQVFKENLNRITGKKDEDEKPVTSVITEQDSSYDPTGLIKEVAINAVDMIR